MAETETSADVIERHGLTTTEYQRVCETLGREPNLTELGIISVMWSEHCSYKSSRIHLRRLPTRGVAVIQGPGENAGVIDVGDGLAAVFKIESHNHPSFIEPYQGAATGVGGIIRDIFTMGARPATLMNSLHFGPLDEARNQVIMEGVVAGIAGYGNCMGIPTIGGEVHFHPAYNNNPLVNAFCLGLARTDRIFYGRAAGAGNPVIYVGSKTGRDGIHGATMASEEFDEDSESKRPTVQVGDPFMEKLLLEACLEAMKSGAVVGIQDMGAAGLTCSTCEMGSRAGLGVEIDLSLVPQREAAMTPYEIMLSESQERMLLVAERGREQELLEIFRKWDLEARVIGQVKNHQRLVVFDGPEKIADLPNRTLTEEAPVYDRPAQRPRYLDRLPDWRDRLPEKTGDCGELLVRMLGSEHLCSRRWVFEQYDHMVRTDTVVLPGSDAAVVRIKSGRGGLAMSLDGNGRLCYLDPRQGTLLLVAEACRNLVCTGARPLAVTNCLNFASPENPEVMWQFIEAVEGLRLGCEYFQTPVTGGNVSFYNETRGEGILPTPVIGMVGKIDDLSKVRTAYFQKAGDFVYLLGSGNPGLGGSIFLEVLGLPLCGPCPTVDPEAERRLQATVLNLIENGVIASAHDVSEGGLAVALAECCLQTGLGVKIDLPEDQSRDDVYLFSEHPGCVVASVSPDREEQFLELAASVEAIRIGIVAQDDFSVARAGRPLIRIPMTDLTTAWERRFHEVFQG